MIVHVTFNDGSNPWLAFDLDKKQVIKTVDRFRKKYGGIISIEIYINDLTIQHDYNFTWFIRHDNKAATFRRLGNAINFCEKYNKKGINKNEN